MVFTGIVLSAVVLLTADNMPQYIAEYVPGPGPMSSKMVVIYDGPIGPHSNSVAVVTEGLGPITLIKAYPYQYPSVNRGVLFFHVLMNPIIAKRC